LDVSFESFVRALVTTDDRTVENLACDATGSASMFEVDERCILLLEGSRRIRTPTLGRTGVLVDAQLAVVSLPCEQRHNPRVSTLPLQSFSLPPGRAVVRAVPRPPTSPSGAHK
jgi:hypothetical protein